MQEILAAYDNGIVAVSSHIGNARQRSEMGLYSLVVRDYTKVRPIRRFVLNALLGFIPQRMRHYKRLLTSSETKAVLDASGLTYTDQFGPDDAEYTARACEVWKKEGKKIVLLPQAFGPFENSRLSSAVVHILDNADLVFARDKLSYDYLMDLGGRHTHIKIAPDFTNLVSGQVPQYFEASNQPCIIPNSKMIEKSPPEIRERYIPFLIECIEHLFNRGLEPFILIHETTDDQELARQIQSKAKYSVNIITEPNPLYVKGILGDCSIVISSRYHGLVSALSQGVPCLGTGWSHKYLSLFEDYGCKEYMISPSASDETVVKMLDKLLDQIEYTDIVDRLQQASLKQKKLAAEMWHEVHQLLQS
jgi:colanic acid/amylovoran biosynthesis protein